MKVKIKKLNERATVPKYQSKGAAGFDLHALDTVSVRPNTTSLIRTGLGFEIPRGYELQIRPRSGLSAKTPLRVANSPGTVDSDYRGEVQIIIHNSSTNPINSITINEGDRIAQGVLVPVIQAEFEEVSELSDTERGNGAFGSTDQ
jgi:dUTP pyrophosphatase